jgi:hypothetical protein
MVTTLGPTRSIDDFYSNDISRYVKFEKGSAVVDWKNLEESVRGAAETSHAAQAYHAVYNYLHSIDVLSLDRKNTFSVIDDQFTRNPSFGYMYYFTREQDAQAYAAVTRGPHVKVEQNK